MAAHSSQTEKDTIPFYPDHVKTEFYVVLGILGLAVIVGVLGLMFPVGLQAPANPLDTPLHVKPEWYFLALYQILKWIPPQVLGIDGTIFGVVSIMLALVAAALLPFLDPKEETTKKPMWIRMAITIIGVILAIALTIWGEVS